MRRMQPGILCSWATDSAFRLEHKFKLVFQVHVTERVIQGLVADHLVVFCASAATRLGIEVFDTGIPFAQRLSTKKAVASLKVNVAKLRSSRVSGAGTFRSILH